MEWACFKNEQRIQRTVFNITTKTLSTRGRQMPRWEQHVRKNVSQKDRRMWVETEEVGLWKNKDTWIWLVARWLIEK